MSILCLFRKRLYWVIKFSDEIHWIISKICRDPQFRFELHQNHFQNKFRYILVIKFFPILRLRSSSRHHHQICAIENTISWVILISRSKESKDIIDGIIDLLNFRCTFELNEGYFNHTLALFRHPVKKSELQKRELQAPISLARKRISVKWIVAFSNYSWHVDISFHTIFWVDFIFLIWKILLVISMSLLMILVRR